MSTLESRAALWLRRYRTAPTAPSVRLVCFAHAGGGPSSFRTWHEGLPAEVDVLAVRYPGRQDRVAEEPLTSMAVLADEVTEALLSMRDDVPLALFGHSMGSWVAYEVARRWESAGLPLLGLFASGQPAPHRDRGRRTHLLDDDGLVEEVRRLGGDEDRMLDEPELRELLLPPIRADFSLSDTYHPNPGKLRAPVRAYAGVEDAEAAEPELLTWAEVTSGTFSHRILPGGHFYLVERESELLRDLAEQLLISAR